ncbi:hypothetical protein EON73_01540, partial [bacterium]
MKTLTIVALLALSLIACGPESSPEGRMGIRMDKLQSTLDSIAGLQKQIDSLKAQNAIIMDSLG